MTSNQPVDLPGTAHGKIDGEYIYLTRRIRLTRHDIEAVQPSRDGEGSTIITSRGAMRVCEDYSALMWHLYGVDTTVNGGAR